MGLNLWNPAGHIPVLAAVITAFLLGMVHGVTPDEHTWPITFSYSVGSYSSKGGMKAGFLFSLAFTLQRAIASELAFFALVGFQLATRWGFEVYAVVGLVMLFSGLYVLRKGNSWHLLTFHRHSHRHSHDAATILQEPTPMPKYMPLVHGFIAGWGVGAFAIIIYTALAPDMPSAWVGWVPGALFGLGTMVMQIILGSLFGTWMAHRNLSAKARAYVARKMSARTLAGGGVGFILIATLGILWPHVLSSLAVVTPIHIHNLHNLGTGFFLAVIVLFGVAIWAFISSRKEAITLYGSSVSSHGQAY